MFISLRALVVTGTLLLLAVPACEVLAPLTSLPPYGDGGQGDLAGDRTTDAGRDIRAACADVLGTDAANCGSCGHSCQGGLCQGGVCQPQVLGEVPDRP
jgi:hypothetical protein